MSGVLSRATRRAAQVQIRHVSVVPRGAAEGLVDQVYAQLERDFGLFAPPVVLHSAVPEALAACWSMLRETLVAAGRVDRAAKEVVASAVSLGNSCPYCVDVHGAALHALAGGRDAAAVAGDRLGSIGDPRLREIAAWARNGKAPGAPIPPEQAAELLGVAITFHYLNRMVNVFLGESPFPPGTPAVLRGGLRRLAGRLLRRSVGRGPAPGASLELLSAARLPDDLAWAAGSPNIADSLARAAAAFETVGVRTVPEAVRELVLVRLADWTGEPPGLSRSWAADAARALPGADRPAGRLALLTAMASYQVDESVIAAFRSGGADDAALVGLTSWASFAAARRTAARPGTGAAPGS
ncbi:carboxymuconolactone decarboxylase family protein [Actinomadura alba]|uniref:Carboxymuconolactone decarboxylase family protein n=1 Tax=Actinomadura alba TaxID=406431 RepID=A0ABR7LRR4_9ACTN|nr:carboxymuconolactone decarboxylase family protein [Actinomadura alba]MBC6467527.1 carboxymuconolactone decarboxylase family protein [Actinomadura alba]